MPRNEYSRDLTQQQIKTGIERLGPNSHTIITRFLEHYLLDDVENRIATHQWSKGPVKIVGDVLLYDGPKQVLTLPNAPLRKDDTILFLNFDSMVVAHPGFIRTPGTSFDGSMKEVLENIAYDTAGTNTEHIIVASWQRLAESLTEIAPEFSVVGEIQEGWARQNLLKHAEKVDPRIWEKALILGHFPVLAIRPVPLYESVSGRPFPVMDD